MSDVGCRISGDSAAAANAAPVCRATRNPKSEIRNPAFHHRSYRKASTGVNAEARQAGQNADATATNASAPNAQAVVVPLTGNPPNISGMGNELTILARPQENSQPIVPLAMASSTPSTRKSIRIVP